MHTSIIQFTKKTAIEIVGGELRNNKKIPCKTHNLSAWFCKTGSKLANIEGTICHDCYAKKGHYATYREDHADGYAKRLEAINHPNWVDAIIKQIGKDKYFRWLASGDLQNLLHLSKIVEVAERMPQTLFWLPTHEPNLVKQYLTIGKIPSNLIIRISAVYIDQEAKLPKSLQNNPNILVSNVHKVKDPMGFECKSTSQGGACLDCRACWDTSVKAVSYKAH